jgi:ankyrin repeat protein
MADMAILNQQLISATDLEDVVAAEAALRAGADPNYCFPSGSRIMDHCADFGNFDVVKILLRYGADPSKGQGIGRVALHYAIRGGGMTWSRC